MERFKNPIGLSDIKFVRGEFFNSFLFQIALKDLSVGTTVKEIISNLFRLNGGVFVLHYLSIKKWLEDNKG